MRYIRDTVVRYILDQSTGSQGTYRFVLPSYPAEVLLDIGKELDEQLKRIVDRRIRLEYGIAYRLGQEWSNSNSEKEKDSFLEICDKGWYNVGDNLTSLRNKLKDPDDDVLVILLAGYDHIDDRASLQDFFHLDQESIWTICLEQSFQTWVVSALKDYVNPEDSESDVIKISDILGTLYNYGLADLIDISEYLESMEFSIVLTVRDAYHLILKRLSPFNLPCMIGLSRKYTRKPFHRYIVPAQEFFNYGMFVNEPDRKKYKKRITNYAKSAEEHLDYEILGEIKTKEELVETLNTYIDNRSVESLNILYSADFVYIYDRILGSKGPTAAVTKRPKKLTGLPPEIFLRAIWITLGDCKRETKNYYFSENISRINLRCLEFKHDFDAGDEGDESIDDKEMAWLFLRKVLGGIDQYLENQIRLEIGSKDNLKDIALQSILCPEDNNAFSYKKTRVAEPSFKFEVQIILHDSESFRREFFWPLPQHHQSRLLVELYDWAFRGFLKSANALPVFFMPYMKEIFMARDEEEVNRLIDTALQSEECSMIDLLTAVSSGGESETKDLLISELSLEYQILLRSFRENGFFYVMDNHYDELRKVYCETFEKFLEKSGDSTFAPFLLKAFMIVSTKSEGSINSWAWQDFLEAAVVTPLHPSVLEMIRHQHAYLCESFCHYAAKAFEESGPYAFSLKLWDRVADHSKIQWPIFGLLVDANKVLDTNMRSYNYIHLAGDSREESSFITSRLLLQYEDLEEEEITATELFRETQSSKLISQVLKDYRNLYAFADDGISIGSYCGKEIQPIIAGIDSYLSQLLVDPKRGAREYSLELTIFSDSRDDSSVIRWVNAWKERWQAAEHSSGKQHYKNCRISIAYRVVSNSENASQFKNLLQNIGLDIMVFSDFIKAGTSDFELLDGDIAIFEDYRKFPVLEKACCKVIGGGRERIRERVLSNSRFRLGALHSEVMARMKKGPQQHSKRHAVISQSDYQPWSKLVDTAHNSSTWVVCIDPSVDEQQIQWSGDETSKGREIIGFGTGVGSHGENNYTISTEQFSMVDIENKISGQISSVLGPWETEECDNIASSLVKTAANIAGLSLVKATGPDRYVRELIANAMVRKLLTKDETLFCDEIISLDALLHWFDDSLMRPDLLRLRAKIANGYFNIEAQVIECKLAQESEGFLEKARQQIESGLRQLVLSFKPREGMKPVGIGEMKPDQRYWWMQLHRLIASKGQTNMAQYKETLLALERLSEGFFTITWQAAAVAFWTDNDNAAMSSESLWDFNFDDQHMEISVASAGKEFIKRACLFNDPGEIFHSDSKIIFKCGVHTIQKPETEREKIDAKVTKKSVSQGDNSQIDKPIDEGLVVVNTIPERILLGGGTAGGRNVYWEFGHPELPNRHILVFGASGTGKTYTIQALLMELSNSGQNSLIVDYTSGFTTSQMETATIDVLKPKQHIIRQIPLAINPFRKQIDYIDDIPLPEDSASTAQRVSGVFSEVYNLGDQQKSALYSAVRTGISQYDNDFNLDKLVLILESIKDEGGPTGSSAASVISKIQPFVDMKPFGKEEGDSWERIYQDTSSRSHIIQLAGFMKDSCRLITEFSLIDLYWYYRAKGNKDNPRVIVLDEIQNLDHRLESPLGQFLTEGRKFGISLILATQTLSNLDKDERDRLFQASHKLFFKPADTEIRTFAQILSDATGLKNEEWINQLSSLKRGECYSLGPALNTVTGKFETNKYFKIRISSLEERKRE